MGQWVQYAMSLQRELLFERNYTHTLIVELDEIVTPLSSKSIRVNSWNILGSTSIGVR